MKLWTGIVKDVTLSGKKALQFTEHQFDPSIFKRVFSEARENDLSLLTSLKLAAKCAHSTITWAIPRY